MHGNQSLVSITGLLKTDHLIGHNNLRIWGSGNTINGFGLACVSLATVFAALRWVLIGKSLTNKQEGYNPIWILNQLAPIMGLITMVASLILEDWAHIGSQNGFHNISEVLDTLSISIGVGCLTTLMILSEYVLAQLTS
jgi:hypothetical protein